MPAQLEIANKLINHKFRKFPLEKIYPVVTKNLRLSFYRFMNSKLNHSLHGFFFPFFIKSHFNPQLSMMIMRIINSQESLKLIH